jgi:hypothetical protein
MHDMAPATISTIKQAVQAPIAVTKMHDQLITYHVHHIPTSYEFTGRCMLTSMQFMEIQKTWYKFGKTKKGWMLCFESAPILQNTC